MLVVVAIYHAMSLSVVLAVLKLFYMLLNRRRSKRGLRSQGCLRLVNVVREISIFLGALRILGWGKITIFDDHMCHGQNIVYGLWSSMWSSISY